MSKKPPKKFKHTKIQPLNLEQKSILDTLKYRQIFNCPMSIHQIWNYLISTKNVEKENFTQALEELVKDKKIVYKDNLYFMGKVNFQDVENRKKRAQKLMLQAKHVAKYLKHLPWIEMAAVTGSVAAFNADEHSDIDLLVITKPKRLWLTRLFLVIILKTLGKYWNTKKPAGTVCPNILLTTHNLTWDQSKQNLYTANEVALLYPLFFKKDWYFRFLQQNSWAKNYLPNINFIEPRNQTKPQTRNSKNVINSLEKIAMRMQISYMKNKKTNEVVTTNLAHFNTHDVSNKVLQEFSKM